MQRSSRRRSVILAAASLAMILYATWLGWPAERFVSWVATGAVALMAALVLVTGERPRLKIAVSSLLLLMMSGVVFCSFADVELLVFDPYSDDRYALFLASLLLLTAVGLQLRWFVIRWLAIALAVAGIMSAGFGLVRWYSEQGAHTWALALHIAGALLVVANLQGDEVRAHFEKHASPMWSSPDPVIRSIRWTILAFFAAILMLLVYAWMQPVVPATAGSALVLAAFFSVSIALAISRRVLGALGLVLGGVGLWVQTGVTVSGAYELSPQAGEISLYYAAFWLPAGLAALVCGVQMTGPLLALLKSDGGKLG